MSSSEVDHSIDLTLGNFNDAAPLFGTDTKSLSGLTQFIGITTYPTTPTASSRQMPPLAPYSQPKQSSSTFNSNGITSSAQSSIINNSSSRTYNNNNNINNNNTIINNNNTAINNVNSYQKSSSSTLQLAPPPQSRANSNSGSITSANSINNTFARPLDNKPLINGRSSYPTAPQLNKHEVNITLYFAFVVAMSTSR